MIWCGNGADIGSNESDMEGDIRNSYSVSGKEWGNRMKGRKISLRSELISMTVGTGVITMIILGIILSVVVFRQTAQREKEDMDFYMGSIQEQFAGRLRFLEEGVAYLRSNKELNDFFRSDIGTEEEVRMRLEQGINLFSERNMVEETYPVVSEIYVFNKKQRFAWSSFYPATMAVQQAREKEMIRMMEEYQRQDQTFYYQQSGNLLELCFTLYDENMDILGYCAAALEKESISNIFEPLKKYESYYWVLQDGGGREVGGSGLPGIKVSQLAERRGILTEGKKRYLYQTNTGSFGLIVYMVIPEEKLYITIKPMFMLAWSVFLFTFLVLILAILYVSFKMTQPMKNIVRRIKQVGTGDFEIQVENYRIQELQEISDSFNDMIQKIDQLIKEVYENQLLAREAKIQYIQAQMNPHFMFNVLSMIGMRLKKHKDEELYRMVTAFSGLMQGKIFRKDEIEIPLKDEMEIVGFYLYLQGQRFRDMISYEIIWEDRGLERCKIPRLSVEPLVENAMIHGFEPKGETGYIRVDIRRKDESRLWIIVEDDGVGFDMEKWNEQMKEEGGHPRVGVMNIQRLIQNLYGEAYGLKIHSQPGNGTMVELVLPLTMENLI